MRKLFYFQLENKEGKRKRKSLEFFRRIGRAVLGNKSSQYNIDNNNEKDVKAHRKTYSKRKSNSSSDSQENKENQDSFYDNVSPHPEKPIAIKVYPSYR